jgi:hypothetical protein
VVLAYRRAAVVRSEKDKEHHAVTTEIRGILPFSASWKTHAFFNFYRRKITAVTGTAVSPVTLANQKAPVL